VDEWPRGGHVPAVALDARDGNPFDPGLPPARARALPWLTVMAGSLCAIVPVVAIGSMASEVSDQSSIAEPSG
jgi:hypothetical protein